MNHDLECLREELDKATRKLLQLERDAELKGVEPTAILDEDRKLIRIDYEPIP